MLISASSVIPAEAGIQRYLDKRLLYFWIPASAGMTVAMDSRYPAYAGMTIFLDSRFCGNDKKAGMTFLKNATCLIGHKLSGNDKKAGMTFCKQVLIFTTKWEKNLKF